MTADIHHIGNLRNDNTLISPLETLEDVKRSIEAGKINPDKLIVLSLQTEDEEGEGMYKVNFFMSNLRVSESVALLETAKADMVDTLNGKS